MEYQLLGPELLDRTDLTPIERVFLNRGIEPQNINHYLQTTEEDILNPLLLENMDRGARMLIKHFAAGDRIFIQVDSDVDGYTSSAALINYLNFIAPGHTQQNISYRLHEGKQHGIILDTIPLNIKLLIVPDAGSNDIEQQRILSEQGIDVLVLDHHEVEEKSPYACIINNQSCDYPTKSLSGVGIVYKFCQYLDTLLNVNYSSKILDLVAIGIISDVMDLRDYETRELITLGFNDIENPFISAFVEKQSYSLKGELTPEGVSFYIAPYINATVRMGSQNEKQLLFESMLNFKAYDKIPSTKRGSKGQLETRVEQACRNCTNIKSRQTKARDTSLEIIRSIIEENDLADNPILIIQLESPVEENLTGLIANQLVGEYQKPVLLLNRHIDIDESTGEVLKMCWRGSGRNNSFSKLDNLRELIANSGLVELAQGHASAFGISVLDENIEQLKIYLYSTLSAFDTSACYYVDFIWSGNNAEQSKNTILDIGNLKSIWGQGLTKPQVAIENIKVTANNLTLMSQDKNPTLKIKLPGDLSLIKFRSSKEEYDSLYSETGCVIINIVGTCEQNVWNGNISPQIIIEDYEIVSKTAYYF